MSGPFPFPFHKPLSAAPLRLLLGCSLLLLLVCQNAGGQQPKLHPVPISEKDAASSQACLSCHEGLVKTRFVHSAVNQVGCAACHEVKTEGESSTVNLTLPEEELCLTCHEKANEPVKHGPYDKGQCLRCHDPHGTDFAKQTRGATNALCSECHLERRVTADTVRLFGKEAIPDVEFAGIPKIGLDPSRRIGHPFLAHPVANTGDPAHKGEEISCLSCHVPHAAPQPKLLRGEKSASEICERCHQPAADQKES